MDDLSNFYEMFSDEQVMRFWSTPPHKDLAQTETYLQSMVMSEGNGVYDFVISITPSSTTTTVAPPAKVIGKIGLWDGHEIGLMLNREYWGRGLMKGAMAMFLDRLWASEEMRGLEDVVADVDPRNSACLGLLKGFGFEETGFRSRTWETAEGWCDSLDLKLARPV
ncbi:MAG: hypothetical protein Q9220_000114 [cf. Caloplaca sp. 1 TL-2023]